jgi:hypothetical protein
MKVLTMSTALSAFNQILQNLVCDRYDGPDAALAEIEDALQSGAVTIDQARELKRLVGDAFDDLVEMTIPADAYTYDQEGYYDQLQRELREREFRALFADPSDRAILDNFVLRPVSP